MEKWTVTIAGILTRTPGTNRVRRETNRIRTKKDSPDASLTNTRRRASNSICERLWIQFVARLKGRYHTSVRMDTSVSSQNYLAKFILFVVLPSLALRDSWKAFSFLPSHTIASCTWLLPAAHSHKGFPFRCPMVRTSGSINIVSWKSKRACWRSCCRMGESLPRPISVSVSTLLLDAYNIWCAFI